MAITGAPSIIAMEYSWGGRTSWSTQQPARPRQDRLQAHLLTHPHTCAAQAQSAGLAWSLRQVDAGSSGRTTHSVLSTSKHTACADSNSQSMPRPELDTCAVSCWHTSAVRQSCRTCSVGSVTTAVANRQDQADYMHVGIEYSHTAICALACGPVAVGFLLPAPDMARAFR